jgi:hypothetical protein
VFKELLPDNAFIKSFTVLTNDLEESTAFILGVGRHVVWEKIGQ